MRANQNAGALTLIKAQDVGLGATAEGVIDSIGGNDLSVVWTLEEQASANDKPSTMKLQESDTDEPTAYEDIPELVGDGVDGFTIPDADTVDAQTVLMNLDLNKRKRFIKALYTPTGSAQHIAVIGMLHRPSVSTEARARSDLVVDV